MGIKTNNGIPFSEQAIRRILKNELYKGYVSWNNYRRRGTKTIKQPTENIIMAKGQHEAIVSEEIWNKADEIRQNNQIVPTGNNKNMTNPLSGLVKCACCGHTMTNKSSTYKEGTIQFMCCKFCNENRGVKNYVLENTILEYLEDILQEFENQILSNKMENKENDRIENLKHTLSLLEKESTELNKQKNNLHDLLERGVYDVDTYLERTQILSKKTDENKKAIASTLELIEKEKSINVNYDELSISIKMVLENYRNTDDIKLKNFLLKSIIDEIIYYKEKNKRTAKFELDIKLKI